MFAAVKPVQRFIRQHLTLGDDISRQMAVLQDHFDARYYLAHNPDVRRAGLDPLRHFIKHGWRERRDPRADFSTSYYLEMNPDIARSGMNPFLHYVENGKAELRESQPYTDAMGDYRPLISVIVPNFNHAAFLHERLTSIADQSYDNIELIVLDDASTDNSLEVIAAFAEAAAIPVHQIANDANSGSVFAQWQRGIDAASGDLIWICESDDCCEPDFLETLVPHFAERSVMMAVGRVEFCSADGTFLNGMSGFREQSEPGIWSETVTRTAQQWFAGAFSVNNIAANVGGCLFRRQPIPADVWDTCKSFRIVGDWYLYSHLMRGGKMVYDPGAVAYFRQHGQNTSAGNFDQVFYYKECTRVFRHLCETWEVPKDTRERFLDSMRRQYKHFKMAKKHGAFDTVMDTAALMAVERSAPHYVLSLLGFVPGGGEFFPINLANTIAARGHAVSLLSANMSEVHEDVLARVRTDIPIYFARDVMRVGAQTFMDDLGASAVHTHMLNCDMMLLSREDPVRHTPYVVSLHGSYDGNNRLVAKALKKIWPGVDGWVYTAEKNLDVFRYAGHDTAGFSFIPNAMPRDPRPFPKSRDELGVADGATVFTLVARGIPKKGWIAAVTAFAELRYDHADRPAHLLLVGEGPATEAAREQAGHRDDVTFLDYQSCINGLYAISDCAIVPTRFAGESFPLCIIQALQEGLPVISTDRGYIRDMLTSEGGVAGTILTDLDDDAAYYSQLKDAMAEMLDPGARATKSALATARAAHFDMDRMTDAYLALYHSVAKGRAI